MVNSGAALIRPALIAGAVPSVQLVSMVWRQELPAKLFDSATVLSAVPAAWREAGSGERQGGGETGQEGADQGGAEHDVSLFGALHPSCQNWTLPTTAVILPIEDSDPWSP